MKTQDMVITWFEIPVKDIDKAAAFYNTIFNIEMQRMEMNGKKFAMFTPKEQGDVCGALCQGEDQPSPDGVKIYLGMTDDVANVLDKVEGAGGKVIVPKIFINDEVGTIGVFEDVDGNHIGVHTHP